MTKNKFDNKVKIQDSNLLMLGKSGSGKSDTLAFLLTSLLAQSKAQIFIITVGKIFNPFIEDCRDAGLSVNKIRVNPVQPVAFNPFSDGLKVIDQIEKSPLNEVERDFLYEIMLAIFAIATKGNKEEVASISHSDWLLVNEIIMNTVRYLKNNGCDQMLLHDIAENGFRRIVHKYKVNDSHYNRAQEMGKALRYLTRDPITSPFFNTPSTLWPMRMSP